jgi:membrane protein DedA with SNARE-associated domain
LLSDLFDHVHGTIEHYGYLAVVVGIFLEHVGLPTPGETLLITGAVAASRGVLNIYVVMFCAWAAGTVGNSVGYAIGYNGGHRLLVRFGGRVGVTEERLKRVEHAFARFGDWVIVFARFVPVLRQCSGLVAGTLEMPWWRFSLLNALGCALWVGLWSGLAYGLGKRSYAIWKMLGEYRPYFYVAVAVLVVIGIAVYFWRRGRQAQSQPAPPPG